MIVIIIQMVRIPFSHFDLDFATASLRMERILVTPNSTESSSGPAWGGNGSEARGGLRARGGDVNKHSGPGEGLRLLARARRRPPKDKERPSGEGSSRVRVSPGSSSSKSYWMLG